VRALILAAVLCLATAASAAQVDSTSRMTKDPSTAVLYSLLLPGLGQVYTETYWKVPLFTGTAAVSAWQFFRNNADFNNTSDLYDQAVASGADANTQALLLAQREAFRDNRDLAGVIFLVTYGLAAVDAYVGAHLFDFDVSDDVSLGIGPTPNALAAVSLRMQW
jgi:hypothetical protein